MQKKTVLFLIGIMLMSILACKKDDVSPTPPNPPATNFDIGASRTANFFGVILTESGYEIQGATVTIGNKTATTNQYGHFLIKNATVNENHAYIKVEQNGYFLGSRSIVPTDGVNNIEIRMLTKSSNANIGSFDANTGGIVSTNDFSIDFESGIVDASGAEYAGNVNVTAKYIDPEDENFATIMPGNLLGVNDEGGYFLQSYGMVAVELTDDSGNLLQLADSTYAEISMNIPSSLQSAAPASIPLWYFDEDNGYWVGEGSATLENGVYKGNVSHFSFWNCDVPTDFVIIDGQVTDDNGLGVADARIKIISSNYGSRYGFTDENGYYSGNVPTNESLTMEVSINCGSGYNLIASENIGTFSSNATLAAIIVNNNTVFLTGTLLDCDNNILENSVVVVNGNSFFVNGSFSIPVCQNTEIIVTAYNIAGNQQSSPQTIMVTDISQSIGTIPVCNNLIEQYIRWNIDGTEYISTNDLYTYYDEEFDGFGIVGISPHDFSYGGGIDAELIIGETIVDANSIYSLNGDGIVYNITSGSITFNLLQWGEVTGDIVEANFSGTVTGPMGSPIGPEETQTITGEIYFIK